MHLRHLYLSPGHNYFGHHGEPAGQHPTLEVETVECVAGQGLRGDRFFGFKTDYAGQVTFFAQEVFERLQHELNLLTATPAGLRRNIVTAGVDLNALIGTEFTVQGITFLGTRECSPCYWMDHAFAPGAEAFLQGQGGLRAKILTSGTLQSSALHGKSSAFPASLDFA